MSENGILEPMLMTEIREMAVIVDAFIPEFSAKIRHPSSNTVGEWYSYVDEIETRRNQACDETISPMSRAATIILHRLESERSLTQLATNVQASGNAASLPLKSAAGMYLDAEKDLLSRAPGIGQARWHTIDDLPDAAKAFAQDVSGLYRLSRNNPVVRENFKTLRNVTVTPPAAGAVTQHVTSGSIHMPLVGQNFSIGACSGYLTFGYAETIAAVNVDHTWQMTLPAGTHSMRLRMNSAFVIDQATGVPFGAGVGSALTVSVDGVDTVQCGGVFKVTARAAAPSFRVVVRGTPVQAGGVQVYAFSIHLEHSDEHVGNGVSETSIAATLASGTWGYDWSPNDKTVLSIVRDYEAFMLVKEANFEPFTSGLVIGAVALGEEAYDPTSWMLNYWGGDVTEVHRVFIKFARRVNVALRLAALDCEFGREQGLG
jgi:hypothetical protein